MGSEVDCFIHNGLKHHELEVRLHELDVRHNVINTYRHGEKYKIIKIGEVFIAGVMPRHIRVGVIRSYVAVYRLSWRYSYRLHHLSEVTRMAQPQLISATTMI